MNFIAAFAWWKVMHYAIISPSLIIIVLCNLKIWTEWLKNINWGRNLAPSLKMYLDHGLLIHMDSEQKSQVYINAH